MNIIETKEFVCSCTPYSVVDNVIPLCKGFKVLSSRLLSDKCVFLSDKCVSQTQTELNINVIYIKNQII